MSEPAMDYNLKQRWIKDITSAEVMRVGEEIFQPGNRIHMTLALQPSAVKYQPLILSSRKSILGLKMPKDYWQFTEFLPGMHVQISKWHASGVYVGLGKLLEVNRDQEPHILLDHENRIFREQRRMFYRMPTSKIFIFNEAHPLEGNPLHGVEAKLVDISASGIGFKSGVFLPPGTRLVTTSLFNSIVAEMEKTPVELEVAWSRALRPKGFRSGAFFLHAGKEPEQMARMVNQLQMIWLSRTHHPVDHDD